MSSGERLRTLTGHMRAGVQSNRVSIARRRREGRRSVASPSCRTAASCPGRATARSTRVGSVVPPDADRARELARRRRPVEQRVDARLDATSAAFRCVAALPNGDVVSGSFDRGAHGLGRVDEAKMARLVALRRLREMRLAVDAALARLIAKLVCIVLVSSPPSRRWDAGDASVYCALVVEVVKVSPAASSLTSPAARAARRAPVARVTGSAGVAGPAPAHPERT